MCAALTLHILRIFAADGIELTEKRRGSFTIAIEKYVFEESTHQM